LAIFGGSFRLVAKAFLPLALLFILSSCGGSGGSSEQLAQELRGRGFTVQVPQGWQVLRKPNRVTARKGDALVSVTLFPLVKPYDPAKFAAVAKELDGVAATLAARAGGTLTDRATATVAGRKIRAYRYTHGDLGLRLGFVLDDKREYQLLCQAPTAQGDPDDACTLLFDSFTLT
jgi:hypothetical protein